jgi:hypothetical protein
MWGKRNATAAGWWRVCVGSLAVTQDGEEAALCAVEAGTQAQKDDQGRLPSTCVCVRVCVYMCVYMCVYLSMNLKAFVAREGRCKQPASGEDKRFPEAKARPQGLESRGRTRKRKGRGWR